MSTTTLTWAARPSVADGRVSLVRCELCAVLGYNPPRTAAVGSSDPKLFADGDTCGAATRGGDAMTACPDLRP